ncbi:hypothetical protein P4O66_022042, partial [Electrophorus voltai]
MCTRQPGAGAVPLGRGFCLCTVPPKSHDPLNLPDAEPTGRVPAERRGPDSNCPLWRFKTPSKHEAERGIKSAETQKYISTCFDDMMQVSKNSLEGADVSAEKANQWEFIDLLNKMLTLDADKRITPMTTPNHPFVTMTHQFQAFQSTCLCPPSDAIITDTPNPTMSVIISSDSEDDAEVPPT